MSVNETVDHHYRTLERPDWTLLNKNYLYGRQHECEKLLHAFDRRNAKNSQSEFVLISGKSGTGKSALAKTLQVPACAKGGFFVMGKFDQMLRSEPYGPLVAAFTDFVQQVLARGEDTVNDVKDAVLKALGTDVCVLIDMIPKLEVLVGSMGPSNLRGPEAQTRLKLTFRDFVRSLFSPEIPLVLVLDDLQWADPGTLDILESLVSDKKNSGITIVGVCRSDEVLFDDYLAAMLRRLEDNKETTITNIQVQELTLEATRYLVSDVLNHPEELCKSIAKTVHAKTGGNIIFIVQLLQTLYSERALMIDPKTSRCILKAKSLINLRMEQDAEELLSRRIQELPEQTQLLLSSMACIGAESDEELLMKILVMRCDVKKALSIAVEAGLIIEDKTSSKYTFTHDKVQQASYGLIPEGERASVHYSIGCSLRDLLSTDVFPNRLYIFVDQMIRGFYAIKDQEEKDTLAALCHKAGAKSMGLGDFKAATVYFWFGISLLREHRKWRDQYNLSLNLYNAAAEAECCVANFEQMECAVEEVLMHATSFTDKIQAYSTRVYSLSRRARFKEAIDLGLVVLRNLGEIFPPRLQKSSLVADVAKTTFMLHRKKDRELLSLPDIDHPDKIAAMGMLNLLVSSAFCAKPELFPFIAGRLVRLSLKFGLCAFSAFGFAAYGAVYCGAGAYERGYKCAQLALKILEKYDKGGIEWIARVYSVVYGMTFVFKQPIRSTLSPLLFAHKRGIETGDIEFSMSATILFGIHSFHSGVPLSELAEKLKSNLELMETYEHSPKKLIQVATVASLDIQTIHNFMGRSEDPLVMTGEIMDQENVSDLTEKENLTFLSNFIMRRLVLAYYFGDHQLALEMADKSRRMLRKAKRSSFAVCIQCFYDGLTALSVAQTSKRRIHVSNARKRLKKMRKLAQLCPQNCMNKVLLMEAEFALLKGDIDSAIVNYNKSIELANKEGFLHEEALASERAGFALSCRKNQVLAGRYYRKAILLYKEWGAHAKVSQMEENLDFYLSPGSFGSSSMSQTADAISSGGSVSTVSSKLLSTSSFC